jgi:hypothetical protein
MNIDEILVAVHPVLAAFEKLGVTYYLGGSVVSSTFGIPRATFDVDVIADLRLEHVQSLVRLLEQEYYIDADMIQDAIRNRASFNVLYLDSMLKVDVFIQKVRPFDVEESLRTRPEILQKGDRAYPVASPEDIILHKLEWYRMGNEVAERQWGDILGVLKVKGNSLDREYLQKWAAQLQVTDLLERALKESGLNS